MYKIYFCWTQGGNIVLEKLKLPVPRDSLMIACTYSIVHAANDGRLITYIYVSCGPSTSGRMPKPAPEYRKVSHEANEA